MLEASVAESLQPVRVRFVGFPVLRTVRIVVFVLQDFAGESRFHLELHVEFGERDVEFLRERQQLVAAGSRDRAAEFRVAVVAELIS